MHVPAMPDASHPRIETWVSFLTKVVGKVNAETFFVGHSVGCQTILRFLQSVEPQLKIGGLVLVAPWIHLTNLSDVEIKVIEPWLTSSLDWNKITNHLQNVIAIFSDNDPWIPLTDGDIFKEKLNSKIIIKKKQGHFSGSDGIKQIPEIIKLF